MPWEGLDFQHGFPGSTSFSIGRFGFGLNSPQGLGGAAWTGDGGIPQGCPLGRVFIVSLCAPWSRHLERLKGISPQRHPDNLKCSSYDVDTLLAAAQNTVSYVMVVGQEASPSNCVLTSTCELARKEMTCLAQGNEVCFGAVKLDVRDLGGHLDVSQRALPGTLSNRVNKPPLMSLQLEPPWSFNEFLGWCAPNPCGASWV